MQTNVIDIYFCDGCNLIFQRNHNSSKSEECKHVGDWEITKECWESVQKVLTEYSKGPTTK